MNNKDIMNGLLQQIKILSNDAFLSLQLHKTPKLSDKIGDLNDLLSSIEFTDYDYKDNPILKLTKNKFKKIIKYSHKHNLHKLSDLLNILKLGKCLRCFTKHETVECKVSNQNILKLCYECNTKIPFNWKYCILHTSVCMGCDKRIYKYKSDKRCSECKLICVFCGIELTLKNRSGKYCQLHSHKCDKCDKRVKKPRHGKIIRCNDHIHTCALDGCFASVFKYSYYCEKHGYN